MASLQRARPRWRHSQKVGSGSMGGGLSTGACPGGGRRDEAARVRCEEVWAEGAVSIQPTHHHVLANVLGRAIGDACIGRGSYVHQYPERLAAVLLSRRLSDDTALSDCSALRRGDFLWSSSCMICCCSRASPPS